MASQLINVQVDRPNEAALRKQASDYLQIADMYEVSSQEDYLFANDQLGDVKKQAKTLDDRRKAITKPLDEAKKQVMDLFRPALDLLSSAEGIWKRKMLAWDNEQDRKRREEEARLREIARKEQERLRRLAESAAAKGNTDKAERMAAMAESMPTPVVAAPVEKASGVSFREQWDFEIVDQSAVPREYLMVDAKRIGGVVRAMKGATNIPGVRVFAQKILARR